MKNLNVLETFRTKEELLNYFDLIGQSITEEEIENLKKRYEEVEENSNALSLKQLNDIAGGKAVFHAVEVTGLKFESMEHLKGFLMIMSGVSNNFTFPVSFKNLNRDGEQRTQSKPIANPEIELLRFPDCTGKDYLFFISSDNRTRPGEVDFCLHNMGKVEKSENLSDDGLVSKLLPSFSQNSIKVPTYQIALINFAVSLVKDNSDNMRWMRSGDENRDEVAEDKITSFLASIYHSVETIQGS